MQERLAVDELMAALRSLDVEVGQGAPVGQGKRADLVGQIDGRRLIIEVKALSRVRLAEALAQVQHYADLEVGVDAQLVVVANRIDASAAAELVEAGIGFWDRATRRLVLRAPGIRIDTIIDAPEVIARVDMTAETPDLRSPFSGVGVRVAYWLLTHPDRPLGVRSVAREINASPTQVSAVAKALQQVHLLDQQRQVPDVKTLFWELAEHWSPAWSKDLVSAERAVLEGGVLVGTVAAVAYGAPAVVGAVAPSLYLPRVVFVPPPPTAGEEVPGVRVAASPAPKAAEAWGPGIRLPDGTNVPAGHPVAVALDLSTDGGRGREILAGWDLDPATASGARRVW